MQTTRQDDRQRQDAGQQAPQEAGGPAGPQAVDAAAAQPAPTAAQIDQTLQSGLPGYAEGTSALAQRLAREQTSQAGVDALASNRTALWSETIAAWRTRAQQDERFVREFGGADPIATQKFADIESEQYFEGNLQSAKTGFYGAVASEVQTSQTARDRIFPLMQRAASPYKFQGKQIAAEDLAALSRRTHGVGSLYSYALSAHGASIVDTWARSELAAAAGMTPVEAAQAGLLPDDKAKLEALKHLLRTSYAGDAKSLAEPSASLARAETWYSPAEVAIRPADPDLAFADMMTVGALQPEWYADGALDLTIEPQGMREARKPTAFDGMMSALWVARNQPGQTYGVTGGGAREFLERGVTWAQVTAAVPVIPSDTWMAELARLNAAVKASAPGSSVGEELLRGNDPGVQATAPAYDQVFGQSLQEAQAPSAVPGQAAPMGPGAAVAGGTFDQAAPGGAPPMHAHPILGGPSPAPAAAAPAAPPPPDPGAQAAASAGNVAGRSPVAPGPAPGSSAIRSDVPAAPPAPASSAPGGQAATPQPQTAANPDVSLHGVGAPPPGWESQEVASGPSERIAPDDPGHIYHLLADGRVVATTQPRLIDPATAAAARAKLSPVAMPAPAQRVPATEQAAITARATERGGTLAPKSENVRGQTVEAQVANGASSMAAKPDFEAAARAFERNLGAAAAQDGLGAAQAMSAKAKAYIMAKVGGAWSRTNAMLETELKKMGSENPGWSGAVGKGIDALMAVFDSGNVATRMNHVGEFYIQVLAQDLISARGAEALVWAEQARLDIDLLEAKAAEAERTRTSGKAPSPWALAPAASPAAAGQTQTRVHRASTADSDAGKADRAATHRTDESAKTAGVSLDPAEATLQAQGDSTFDPRTSRLRWEEGARVWIMNEADQWVRWARQMSLPLAAGPSGTTNMLMTANDALNATSAVQARLACIGYLLPANHHSLVEVMAAAAPFGAAWTPGPDMYKDIEPYSPSALRGFGGGRFPGESDPAGTAAAAPVAESAPKPRPVGA